MRRALIVSSCQATSPLELTKPCSLPLHVFVGWDSPSKLPRLQGYFARLHHVPRFPRAFHPSSFLPEPKLCRGNSRSLSISRQDLSGVWSGGRVLSGRRHLVAALNGIKLCIFVISVSVLSQSSQSVSQSVYCICVQGKGRQRKKDISCVFVCGKRILFFWWNALSLCWCSS